MASLRTLLQIGEAAGGGPLAFDQLYVFNTSKDTAANGGRCCLWTVPAGVNWFAIELWGGGGGGGASCCCHQNIPGGSGSYSRRFITGLSGAGGETYTMCAASSTGCSQATTGCQGFPSFVNINGGAVQVCASGGSTGCSRCFFGSGCSYNGCPNVQCGSWVGTMGICGMTGGGKGSAFCHNGSWGWMPSAPFTSGGTRGTRSNCQRGAGCDFGGFAHWPGGGGASATEHSGAGQFCGAAGAGGLISIYYPIVS